MGQRHQVYVVSKQDNKYRALGAFHHQWCYGLTAIVNATRAAQMIAQNKRSVFNDGKWSSYSLSDSREIETVIKATFGVSMSGSVSMVHNCNDDLIDETTGKITPERGDNNDGCTLLVIDNDAEQVRVGMFTPGHVEGSHGSKAKKNKLYSRADYLAFYYKPQEHSSFDESMKQALKYFESAECIEATQDDLKNSCKPRSRAKATA